MTAAVRACRSTSKASFTQMSRIGRCTLSTSTTKCKDEDEIKTLETNPYFGKYSQKITELQKTTPEELSRRVAAVRQSRPTDPEQSNDKLLCQPSPFTKRKSLDDIMKMELLVDKSDREVSDIWLNHHSTIKDTVSVVISSEVFNLIVQLSSKHPTFLLPLPRDHGYEFFVSQACGNEFHLTPLINYQAFKENAPECLALYHFTELSDKKGIVLMRGEYNSEILDVAEAMCLTNQLHRYYGEVNGKRLGLLERFTNSPSEFRHMDLIVELEKMVK